MRAEPSKLARLVIAYHERFGRHVPEPTLRHVKSREMAAILEDSLATGVPIPDGEFGWLRPLEFGPGGCILREERPERALPKRGPDGRWIK